MRRRRRHPDSSRAEDRTAATIAELTRSRRLVATAYERERRRIERDLHDGAQQYFVAASMLLGEARLAPEVTDSALGRQLGKAQEMIDSGLAALRETVRGIHPRVLADLGIVAAVEEAAAPYPQVSVRCPHPLPDLDPAVLAAAYFFATECLTNCARYAPGATVSVLITAETHLRISVVDEGPGGAELVDGGGLAGMRERLLAFDGFLEVNSPIGGPTKVVGAVPLMIDRGTPGVVAGSEKDVIR